MLPRSVLLLLLMCSCLLGIQGQQTSDETVDFEKFEDYLNPDENSTDFEQLLNNLMEGHDNNNNNITDYEKELETLLNQPDSNQALDDPVKADESHLKPNIENSNALTDCINKVDSYQKTINNLVDKFLFKKRSEASAENLKQKINSNVETIIKHIKSCYAENKFPEISTKTNTTTTTPTTTTTTTTTTPTPATTTTTESLPNSCGLNQECVQLGRCSTSEVTDQQKYVISIDFLSEECHYLETCCDKRDITSVSKVCSEEPDTFSNGVANPSGICMTLEGERSGVANFGQFPWAVSIWTTEPEEYFNGGSLIRSDVVLTTYNLFKTKNSTYKVRAGDWDMATMNEVLMYHERPVERIIHYENFSLQSFSNNIALLILKEKFSPLAHIKPIDLPVNIKLDYNKCIVTGWEANRRSRWLLKSMSVDVEECKGPNKDNSFMCVWKTSSELRYSLGSPLICPKLDSDPNKYYQYGAWSHGISNVDLRFVNIVKQMHWINNELNKHVK